MQSGIRRSVLDNAQCTDDTLFQRVIVKQFLIRHTQMNSFVPLIRVASSGFSDIEFVT